MKVYGAGSTALVTAGEMVGEIPLDPQPVLTQVDKEIAFNWWDGSPSGLDVHTISALGKTMLWPVGDPANLEIPR